MPTTFFPGQVRKWRRVFSENEFRSSVKFQPVGQARQFFWVFSIDGAQCAETKICFVYLWTTIAEKEVLLRIETFANGKSKLNLWISTLWNLIVAFIFVMNIWPWILVYFICIYICILAMKVTLYKTVSVQNIPSDSYFLLLSKFLPLLVVCKGST